VLLVGTGEYVAGSRFDAVPAVRTTVQDLADCLTGSCGVPADNVRVLVNPAKPDELASALAEACEAATDTLLFYYVGHGAVDDRNDLFLTTRATADLNAGLPPVYQALQYREVQRALSMSGAQRIVVILDCCFAGRAASSIVAGTDDVYALTGGRDTYLLTSAARDRVALALPGERHTAFSGALIELLRAGDPAAPPYLDIAHVYDRLSRELPAAERPRPQGHASNQGARIVVARNRAFLRRAQRPASRGRRTPDPAVTDGACPYPGLSAFELDDARFFHGRDALTSVLAARLADRIADPRPLVVLGPSGAGKSSLLRAGLVPALRRGELGIAGSWQWPVRQVTPGSSPRAGRSDPLGALVLVAADLLRVDADRLRPRFIAQPGVVGGELRVALARVAPGTRLVLLVDQFEELFSPEINDADRASFAAALTALTDEAAAVVVIALRADHFADCAGLPALRQAMEGELVLVRPMTRGELADAIENPALEAGLNLEPGLKDLLLREIHVHHGADLQEVGTLPLLAHALRLTWQRSDGTHLTISAYAETGGMARAVAKTADDAYSGLDREGREAARRLLLGLVRLGPNGETTRRRRDLGDLLAELGAGSQARAVLDAFATPTHRLVTVQADSVEITHEVLIRAWPRLRRWIARDRERLRASQQVTDDATTWEHAGRDPSTLYRGTRLALALEALGPTGRAELGTLARAFLDASAHVARRRSTVRRVVTVALAVLLVLALIGGGVGVVQWRTLAAQKAEIDQQEQITWARRLLVGAEDLASREPLAAFRLALAAHAVAPIPEATTTLLTMIQNVPTARAVLARPSADALGQRGDITAIAIGTGPATLAVGYRDGLVELWSTGGMTPTRLQDLPSQPAPVTSLAFGAAGLLAVGSGTGVTLWRTGDSPTPEPVPANPLADMGPDAVPAVAFSPSGHLLVVDDGRRQAQVWSVSDRGAIRRLAELGDTHSYGGDSDGRIRFGSSDEWLAIASVYPQVWDLGTLNRPALHAEADSSAESPLALSPDGLLLAVARSTDGDVELWDLRDAAQPQLRVVLTGHGEPVRSLDFSPDGTGLATASEDDTVALWSLDGSDRPSRTATLTDHHADVRMVRYSPDGQSLITAGADNRVRLWNLGDARPKRAATIPDYAAAVTLDGRMVAAINDDDATFWDIGDPAKPTRSGSFELRGSTLIAVTDGIQRLLAAFDGEITLWNHQDGGFIGGTPASTPGSLTAVEVAPNGQVAVSVGPGVALWDISDRAGPGLLAELTDSDTPAMRAAAFAADGRLLAFVGADGALHLWDIEDPRRPKEAAVTGAAGPLAAVAAAPGGTLVAAGGADGTVTLWDVADPRGPRWLSASITHPTAVTSIDISPDGVLLAVAGAGGATELWDVRDAARPVRRATLDTEATEVWFADGGSTVVTAEGDRNSLWDRSQGHESSLWDLSALVALAGHEQEAGCAAAGGGLSPADWPKYVAADIPFVAACG